MHCLIDVASCWELGSHLKKEVEGEAYLKLVGEVAVISLWEQRWLLVLRLLRAQLRKMVEPRTELSA
jgi:hypothetical protein